MSLVNSYAKASWQQKLAEDAHAKRMNLQLDKKEALRKLARQQAEAKQAKAKAKPVAKLRGSVLEEVESMKIEADDASELMSLGLSLYWGSLGMFENCICLISATACSQTSLVMCFQNVSPLVLVCGQFI